MKWLQLVFTTGAVIGTVVGTIGGFGAGVLAGMLTAPKEGKQTREDIANMISDIIAEAKSKGVEFSEALTGSDASNGKSETAEATKSTV